MADKIKNDSDYILSSDMEKELAKPLKNSGIASTLPWYNSSEFMYERFLQATICEADEITRAINKRGIKIIDNEELEFDNLNYFYDNSKKLQEEFFEEIATGITEERAELFCRVIREHWYGDGKTEPDKKPVLQLMASIRNYILRYGKAKSEGRIRVQIPIDKEIQPNFSEDEINEILNTNLQMLDGHLLAWLRGHRNYLEMGTGDIYLRRGLHLSKVYAHADEYSERQYINSYSLAFSVTEKFAQIMPKHTPAILNTNFSNVRNRILFFSPFIQGMNPHQLEFGIIPCFWSQKIKHSGEFGGIHEYEVD